MGTVRGSGIPPQCLFFPRKGSTIPFVVYLPGILFAEAEISGDLSQCRTISYHGVKHLKCILAVFLPKLALKFVGWLNAKFIAPVGDCSRPNAKQTSNLCVTQCLSFYFFSDKLLYV